jgi:hypothetical protein
MAVHYPYSSDPSSAREQTQDPETCLLSAKNDVWVLTSQNPQSKTTSVGTLACPASKPPY